MKRSSKLDKLIKDTKDEIKRLTIRVDEININLTEFRSQGDLSENTAYLDAVQEMDIIEASLNFNRNKEALLLSKRESLVDSIDFDYVSDGSYITIYCRELDKRIKLIILLNVKSDYGQNILSNDVPLFKRIENRTRGDKFMVKSKTVNREFEFIIEELE